jgi:hypothetical protein
MPRRDALGLISPSPYSLSRPAGPRSVA